MTKFLLKSNYSLSGDQARAVESLVSGINDNRQNQVLLGVTGSGKTFAMANVIQQCQKPALIMAHNKTLAAQLYEEMKGIFQIMQSNILFRIMIITSLKHI